MRQKSENKTFRVSAPFEVAQQSISCFGRCETYNLFHWFVAEQVEGLSVPQVGDPGQKKSP